MSPMPAAAVGSAQQAWNELLAAADRPSVATGATPEHRPRAAVLACADARVPPSIVFGQPAGSLFVVRHAGNTATPSALASLDYAVAQLGVRLVIVLGHTGCGAVTEAVACARSCVDHPLVGPILPAIEAAGSTDVDTVVVANVVHTMAEIQVDGGPLGHAVRTGEATLRGAVYDLATGRLRPVPTTTPIPTSSLFNHQGELL